LFITFLSTIASCTNKASIGFKHPTMNVFIPVLLLANFTLFISFVHSIFRM